MGWATVADVSAVTTRAVDADTLTVAQSMVEVFVDRYSPDDDTTLSTRDLARLKKAVCWQAAWLASNPAVDARGLVSTTSQDGATAVMATRDAVVLAPLAKRAIRNLQLRRRNTVRMVSDFETEVGFAPDPNDDIDSDNDEFVWTPFPPPGWR